MSHNFGWQEEWLGRYNDKDEPTFDLVRSKSRSRAQANGLVWRAPSQIAQLRSQEPGDAEEAPRALPARVSDPDIDLLSGAFVVHRSRRRRVVQVLGGLLLGTCIWAGFRVISSSPKARTEALSWVTLGHPQEADHAIRIAESKVRRLLGK
jgi:hypothetical protein